ncbi:hypothetical protein AB1Y20_012396 [Prymnesium parvum]|uniref:Uncharacterized protein n=1 Tax=Prymnesium parvum TaxID=97485 RepID=A0AB34IRY6_PRYPA
MGPLRLSRPIPIVLQTPLSTGAHQLKPARELLSIKAAHLRALSPALHEWLATLRALADSLRLAGEGARLALPSAAAWGGELAAALSSRLLSPLSAHAAKVAAALELAHAYDAQADALAAAELRHLGLSRDAPLEVLAHSDVDVSDKAALAARLFVDCRAALEEAAAELAVLPQLAIAGMVRDVRDACAEIAPRLEAEEAEAKAKQTKLQEDLAEYARVRATLPQPQLRSGTTLCEGWLYKGAFNLSTEVNHHALNRFKPWNKRWFVLSSDGRLYYYKSPDDVRTPKVPIEMKLLSAVIPVGDTLEFHLHVGSHELHLKAVDGTDRHRWLEVLGGYLKRHAREREEHRTLVERLYTAQGAGVRDIDGRERAHSSSHKAGYLYRQEEGSHRFRRCWCVVEDGKLTCSQLSSLHISPHDGEADSPDGAGPPSIVLQLITVTVREARKLPVLFAFEVISPRESILLQAQSQEEMYVWIAVIQNATASMLNEMPPRAASAAPVSDVLQTVRQIEGNSQCADCGAPSPTWASINLGITLCLACAGVHRQLGVHLSKVRSLELDTKEWTPPVLGLMARLGNSRANAIWAAQPAPPLAADAPPAARAARLRLKYESRAFLCAPPPAGALLAAAAADDVPLAAACLAHRAAADGAAAAAAAAGAEGALELLLLHGAPADGALRAAREAGHAACVAQLLRRGADDGEPTTRRHSSSAPPSPMALRRHAVLMCGYLDKLPKGYKSGVRASGSGEGQPAGKASSKLLERWERRYFVLRAGGTLSYYKSEADQAAGKEPLGSMDCTSAAVYLTKIVKGGFLSEAGYRFTVLTAERELKLRAPDETEFDKWLSVLRPNGCYKPMGEEQLLATAL